MRLPSPVPAAALATVLFLAACGGAGETATPTAPDTDAQESPTAPATESPMASADGVAEAQEIVEDVSGPVEWTDPGPPVKVGDSLNGMTAYFVGNLSFEFDQNLLAGYEEAAEALGMEVVAVDAAGSAAQAGTLIEQAIGQNADVIVNKGFPEDAIVAPLRAAAEADIPVIGIGEGVPELPSEDLQELGVFAFATYCYPCAGQEMAAWVVSDSGGNANVAIFQAPELSVTPAFNAAIVETLDELCPECEHQTVDLPLAQWQQSLASLTTSTLQSNPDINYIIALFDPMTSLMVPAIDGMDASDRVKIIARGAAPAAMELLAGGQIHANVGGPQRWLGWALMDQSVRALVGAEPLEDEKIPNRLFTIEDAQGLDLSVPEAEWYGDVDYAANYLELWAVE